jgi:hypothetical protein
MRAPFPAYLILLHFITLIMSNLGYTLCSSSLCNFLYHSETSLLGANILLSTLFSNTLNLCSSLRARDHKNVPNPNVCSSDFRGCKQQRRTRQIMKRFQLKDGPKLFRLMIREVRTRRGGCTWNLITCLITSVLGGYINTKLKGHVIPMEWSKAAPWISTYVDTSYAVDLPHSCTLLAETCLQFLWTHWSQSS